MKNLVLSKVVRQLQSSAFANEHKTATKNFSRTRVLSFVLVNSIILRQVSKSIGVEISSFLLRMGKRIVSKQAFSKARYKIKSTVFKTLNTTLIDTFYKVEDYKTYKGKYLLWTVDGTDLQLPWSKDTVAYFGQMNTGKGAPVCIGKSLKVWDALNEMVLWSDLYDYNTNEIKKFEQHIDEIIGLQQKVKHPVLLLADRAYPSFHLFNKLILNKIEFIFRCKKDQCTEIKEWIISGQQDSAVVINMNNYRRKEKLKRVGKLSDMMDEIPIRMVKGESSAGEVYYLVTSLSEDEYSLDEIKSLYAQRWGIETSFRYDKCCQNVENFSSKKTQGVLQEWHAAMLCSNIAQLLIRQAQQLLDQQKTKKTKKYTYKINRRIAITLIKDQLPKLLNRQIAQELFEQQILSIIARYREPYRPDRTFNRYRKCHFKFNQIYR